MRQREADSVLPLIAAAGWHPFFLQPHRLAHTAEITVTSSADHTPAFAKMGASGVFDARSGAPVRRLGNPFPDLERAPWRALSLSHGRSKPLKVLRYDVPVDAHASCVRALAESW